MVVSIFLFQSFSFSNLIFSLIKKFCTQIFVNLSCIFIQCGGSICEVGGLENSGPTHTATFSLAPLPLSANGYCWREMSPDNHYGA